jgi:hypothetical protein
MRELVVKYLSHDISRRKFVSGLTKAGLTATAANSVLASVGSVSLAQGVGPAPAAPAAAAAAPPAAASAAARTGSAVTGVKSFQDRAAPASSSSSSPRA